MSQDLVLPRYRAVDHLSPAPQGSRHPHFFICEAEDGELRQLLVKQLEPEPSVREILGNVAARLFGLRTPEPAIVTLTGRAVESVKVWAEAAERYCPFIAGPATGCLKVDLSQNIPPSGPFAPHRANELRRMVFFDVLFGYADRTANNPNCGVTQEGLVVFDFEQLFGEEERFESTNDPGEAQSPIQILAQVHGYTGAARKGRGGIEDIAVRLRRVQQADWHILLEQLPKEWQRGGQEVVEMIMALDGNMLIPEIARVLR